MKFKLSLIAAAVMFSAVAHAETNPFTGARVETEQVKAKLELQREKNALSKEELEAKRIEFQAKHADKVMLADLNKMLAPTPGAYPSALDSLPMAAPAGKKPAAKPSVKPVIDLDGQMAGLADGAAVTPRVIVQKPAQVSWSPKLVAVLDNRRERLAVIESGGEATTVAVGDRMAIGVVTEIGEGSVTVGGKTLLVDRTTVALNNPDAQDPASLTGGRVPGGGGSPAAPGGGIRPPGFQPGLVR